MRALFNVHATVYIANNDRFMVIYNSSFSESIYLLFLRNYTTLSCDKKKEAICVDKNNSTMKNYVINVADIASIHKIFILFIFCISLHNPDLEINELINN